MKIIVQKFGGTSLKSAEDRRRASQHVEKAAQDGYKVVVVVSAMGRTSDPYATDTLIGLIGGREAKVTGREWDLLASCGEVISAVVFTHLLNHSGLKAITLTGAQAGIRTNHEHRKAKIINMKCERLYQALRQHEVVVVAGFQGQTYHGDVTTIGRGGSDTSAAALGAVLKAEWIDIFTDVDGLMTADPHIVRGAHPLSRVTYNEICHMAYQGAKVIHPRAVEIAMKAQIPIRIRSTYSSTIGTLVTSIDKVSKAIAFKERLVTGIAHVNGVTQIKVCGEKGKLDWQTNVFQAMAQNGISVDLININPNGVIYTVMDESTDQAVKVLEEIGFEPNVTRHCAKVSAVGAGIAGVPGVAAQIVGALTREGIQILQSADSHTTIWVLVKNNDLVNAVNALHETFELGNINERFPGEIEKESFA